MNVLLIHGLGRTSMSMAGMAHFLRSRSFTPHTFSYWAWQKSYADIVAELRSQLTILSQQGDYVIVAHPLGGILSRSALDNLDGPSPRHVVMLGPPNRQPRLAAIARQIPPFQWFTQDCGAQLNNSSFYQSLPTLTCPYTIMAGNSGPRGSWSPFKNELNDGIVAVSETLMQDRDRPLLFPVFHTFMMNHRALQNAVCSCLRGD